MSRSRLLSPIRLVAAIGGAAALVFAVPSLEAAPPANEVLYVANSAGGKIVRVNEDGSTTPIVSGLKDLSSLLALREASGHISLVACADKVLFFANVTDPSFNGLGVTIASIRCNGIARDANANLFFVKSGPGNGGGKKEVWMIPRGSGPGGYDLAEIIDGDVNAETLEHVAVVRSDFGDLLTHDLLVLAGGKKNARVIVYRKNDQDEYEKHDDHFIDFANNADPKGLAFGGGHLLVSLQTGQIKSFDDQGGEHVFASGLSNGVWKIETGSQGDIYRVFAAQRHGHKVLSMKVVFVSGNPVAGPTTVFGQGFNFPQDVAIGQDSTFITAQASFKASFDSQDVTLKNTQSGPGELSCGFTGVDPRESECDLGTCDDLGGVCDEDDFCRRELDATEVGLPYAGLKFPGDVRSLKIGHPANGVPKFFACVGKAPAFSIAEHFVHEDQFLNWPGSGPKEPACDEEDTSKRAIFFRGTIPGEPDVAEGDVIVPYPTGCVDNSSNRGDIDDYSVILPAARLLTPFCEVVDDRLANLLEALDMFALFIDEPVEGDLRRKRAVAAQAYTRYKCGNAEGRVNAMKVLDDSTDTTAATPFSFVGIVEANSGSIHNDIAGRNISGELIARARAARYLIDQVTPELLDTCPCP